MPVRPLAFLSFVALLAAARSTNAQCEIDVVTNPTNLHGFGGSVAATQGYLAVGMDGEFFAISVPGIVGIYRPTSEGWIAQTALNAVHADPPASGVFGRAVAADNGVLAVGDSWANVFIYRLENGSFELEQQIHNSTANGFSRSLAINNDLVVAGAPDADTPDCQQAGKVFVYRYNDAEWIEEAQLSGDYCNHPGSTLFGYSVATAKHHILVGDHTHNGPNTNTGAVFAYRYVDGEWVLEQTLKPSAGALGNQWFGYALAIDASGTTVVIGSPNHSVAGVTQAGSAYIFEYDGEQWTETALLTTDPLMAFSNFGERVTISNDGETAIVRHSSTPGAYIFKRKGTEWIHFITLPLAGAQMAMDGDLAFISGAGQKIHIFAGMIDVDCNESGNPDGCDIALGFSQDLNGDGIPDECQTTPDLTGDGFVGVADLLILLENWGPCKNPPPPLSNCPADLNGDGAVGAADLLILLGSWGELHPPPPPPDCSGLEGDCCLAHGGHGCEDPECCEAVCTIDPFCCGEGHSPSAGGGWDMICMHLARDNCDCQPPEVCGDRTAGPCCIPGTQGNGTPGCDDAECCALICDYIDPFCCDVEWDQACNDWAMVSCNCPPWGCNPDNNDCCEVSSASPGCNDIECCSAVCALEPDCCAFWGWWQHICANLANQICDVCQDGG